MIDCRRYLFSLLFFTVITVSVLAEDSNPHEFVIGGRSALMGGAYTAISDDSSALFFNPSGMSHARQGVTLNTTSFYKKNIKYRKVLNGEDFNHNSSSSYPAILGALYKTPYLTLGYSVITQESKNTKQTDYFKNISSTDGFAKDYSRYHQETNNKQLFGAGFSYLLNSITSVGASIFYYQREVESVIHQNVVFPSGKVNIIDTSSIIDSNGFKWSLGLMLRWPAFSVGTSVSGSEVLTENFTLTNEVSTYDEKAEQVFTNEHNEDKGKSSSFYEPPVYRLGFAWFPYGFLTTSLDLIYHPGLKIKKVDLNNFFESDSTLNLSFGLEFKLTNFYLLTGVFSNNSLNPKIAEGSINQLDHINYTGFSAGLGFFIDQYYTSLGYIEQRGEGKAQKIAGSTSTQDVEAKVQIVLLSLRVITK